jgi:hypothetical protein
MKLKFENLKLAERDLCDFVIHPSLSLSLSPSLLPSLTHSHTHTYIYIHTYIHLTWQFSKLYSIANPNYLVRSLTRHAHSVFQLFIWKSAKGFSPSIWDHIRVYIEVRKSEWLVKFNLTLSLERLKKILVLCTRKIESDARARPKVRGR